MRFLLLSSLCIGLASCAHSQSAAPAKKLPLKKLPLNTLLVSGGPTRDYNQYAIESNARYLEKLTAGTPVKRILFADGHKATRSIVTQQSAPDQAAQDIFAWIFDTSPPEDKTVYRTSTLGRIDGPSTKKSITDHIGWLVDQAKNGQKSLLYFTGHGSAGEKDGSKDDQNTTYALWGGGDISVHEVAESLKEWPAGAPLVVVMVQCHAGGFANLMFEGGDPNKPLLDRDFCGFFAATGDRMASGCTPEVDETDYQDFTTHFFAALSGVTRDGKKVSGADYDHNGGVSMLEAMAWTALHDSSIDVPVCTSDAYLRTIFPQTKDMAWSNTPYSQLVKMASPWQKAVLEGLSKTLGLKGESRIVAGMKKVRQATAGSSSGHSSDDILDNDTTSTSFYRLEAELKRRFPALKAKPGSARFNHAKPGALRYLTTRKADLAVLAKALKDWYRSMEVDDGETTEAQAIRFVRTTRTLVLEQRLAKEGTAPQKAAFARLRSAESRNPLR